MVAYSSASIALRELQQFEEADAILAVGLQHHPDHPELLGNHAWVAHARRDWPEALERWMSFARLFPNEVVAHQQTMFVLRELGRFAEADALVSQAVRQDLAGTVAPGFFLEFESLGDNCEFGRVQSYFGVEPLGLLRFAATPPHLLTDALLNRFEGVGDAEYTTLSIHQGHYWTGDSRYRIAMNTFISAEDDHDEKRFAKFCRRLRYLKEKLIADLEEARKIFVYCCHAPLEKTQIVRLWQALQSYGDNRLLFVLSADGENLPGTVRMLERDLIVGYLDQSSVDDPSYSVWLGICRESRQIWHYQDVDGSVFAN